MATQLSVLEQRVQTLYDVSGSTVLSAAELDQFINDAYRTLWATVTGINKDFRVTPLLFTLAAGVQAQALPVDFMEERYVRLNPGQENQVYLTRNNRRTGSMNFDRSYEIQGANVVIEPLQRAAGSYSLDYIPQPPALVNPTDTLDAELDQFADFIVYHATVAALAREETATDQMEGMLGGIMQRVTRWASSKRSASPDRIEDVRRRSPWMFVPP